MQKWKKNSKMSQVKHGFSSKMRIRPNWSLVWGRGLHVLEKEIREEKEKEKKKERREEERRKETRRTKV